MKRLIALLLVGTGLALVQPGTAQAQAIVNGVITAFLTIQVNTTVPAGASVVCEFTVSTFDPTSTNTETVTATATGGPTIYKCTLAIPYYWWLSTPGSDPVSLSYTVGILPSNASIVQQAVRFGTHTLPSLTSVPSDGTHTNINAPTTRL